LTKRIAFYNICPFQDASVKPTRVSSPNVGRSSRRGRSPARCERARRASSPSPRPRGAVPRARHLASAPRAALVTRWRRLLRRPSSAGGRITARLPSPRVLSTSRPRAPARRGRWRPDRARARAPRAHDPRREGRQSDAEPCGSRVGGTLPRAAAMHPARGAPRARIRVAELPEAHPDDAWGRRVFLRRMVYGMGNAVGCGEVHPPGAGGGRSDLACRGGLAAAWPDRARRGAGATGSSSSV
jgi:hypothetical protein